MNKFMKSTRRFVTLIEMVIVMFLIAMIIGVVAYNYQGSLDEGKAFKTKASMDKIQTILILHLSEKPDANIESEWKEILKKSPLVPNAKQLSKDGWGEDFEVRVQDDRILISSKKFNAYRQKNPSTHFNIDEDDN